MYNYSFIRWELVGDYASEGELQIQRSMYLHTMQGPVKTIVAGWNPLATRGTIRENPENSYVFGTKFLYQIQNVATRRCCVLLVTWIPTDLEVEISRSDVDPP